MTAGWWRLLGAGFLVAACVSGGDRPPPAGPPGWELVWADEFEAPFLDRESWTAEVMPDPFNEELQRYTDRIGDAPGANAWLDKGALSSRRAASGSSIGATPRRA